MRDGKKIKKKMVRPPLTRAYSHLAPFSGPRPLPRTTHKSINNPNCWLAPGPPRGTPDKNTNGAYCSFGNSANRRLTSAGRISFGTGDGKACGCGCYKRTVRPGGKNSAPFLTALFSAFGQCLPACLWTPSLLARPWGLGEFGVAAATPFPISLPFIILLRKPSLYPILFPFFPDLLA